MTKHLSKLGLIASFISTGFLISCQKEELSSQPLSEPAALRRTKDPIVSPPATLYNLNVNWNNRTDGGYAYTQSYEDFGNAIYWDAFNTQTNTGILKATLAKDIVGPVGGAMSRMDVPDAAEYQLQYDIKFDSQFDFSAGGKVGFGCLIGAGYTGGVPGTDGNGGSARIMWYKGTDGRVYLKPYLYYKDQPGIYGNDFGKTYPSTGSIQKGVWYTVKMIVKSNTGSNTDGRYQLIINGTTVMDQAVRWTTNDLQRLVNKVCFENFRGGSEAYWASTTDGSIYFDNVSFTAY
jgi:hypothetical protein